MSRPVGQLAGVRQVHLGNRAGSDSEGGDEQQELREPPGTTERHAGSRRTGLNWRGSDAHDGQPSVNGAVMHSAAASRRRCTSLLGGSPVLCRDPPADLVMLELRQPVDHQIGSLHDAMEVDDRGVHLDALIDRYRTIGDSDVPLVLRPPPETDAGDQREHDGDDQGDQPERAAVRLVGGVCRTALARRGIRRDLGDLTGVVGRPTGGLRREPRAAAPSNRRRDSGTSVPSSSTSATMTVTLSGAPWSSALATSASAASSAVSADSARWIPSVET